MNSGLDHAASTRMVWIARSVAANDWPGAVLETGPVWAACWSSLKSPHAAFVLSGHPRRRVGRSVVARLSPHYALLSVTHKLDRHPRTGLMGGGTFVIPSRTRASARATPSPGDVDFKRFSIDCWMILAIGDSRLRDR